MAAKIKIQTLNREKTTSKIIDDDIALIKEDATFNDYSYINDIMSMGFKGYDNFTNEELQNEYETRFDEKIKIKE